MQVEVEAAAKVVEQVAIAAELAEVAEVAAVGSQFVAEDCKQHLRAWLLQLGLDSSFGKCIILPSTPHCRSAPTVDHSKKLTKCCQASIAFQIQRTPSFPLGNKFESCMESPNKPDHHEGFSAHHSKCVYRKRQSNKSAELLLFQGMHTFLVCSTTHRYIGHSNSWYRLWVLCADRSKLLA